MLKSCIENLYFLQTYAELMYQSCVKKNSDNIYIEVMFKIKLSSLKELWVKVVRVMKIMLENYSIKNWLEKNIRKSYAYPRKCAEKLLSEKLC